MSIFIESDPISRFHLGNGVIVPAIMDHASLNYPISRSASERDLNLNGLLCQMGKGSGKRGASDAAPAAVGDAPLGFDLGPIYNGWSCANVSY